MEVENQVQFAHVAKVLVEYLNKSVNKLQNDQLVFVLINDRYEIQWGVSFVHDFVVFVLNEIACFGFSGDDQLVDLTIESKSTSLRKRCF